MKTSSKIYKGKIKRGRMRQGGQAIITAVIFFLTISIIILVAMASPVAYQVRNSADFLQSKQGYIAADTLNEEALYRLNKNWSLPASLVLSFSGATSTAQITDVSGTKQVIASGVAGSFTRTTKGVFSLGAGLSIVYGVQVGNGGVTMSGSSRITGNVYANGNITASGSCNITGTAIAAAATSETSDQSNSASGTPAVSTSFATSSSSYQDLAQSFTVSTSTAVAEVSLYMKKTGSPSNATVAIYASSGGSPTGSALASGVLSASAVTTNYGWVELGFTTNPSLTPGNTYWLVIDTSSISTSNYYSVGTTNTDSYAAGSMKIGKASNQTWVALNSSYDEFFQLFLGGVSSINGVIIGSGGVGDARAFNVSNSTVSGSLYCQTGTGNNKSCDTSQVTPSYLSFPFSANNIADWKADAAGGAVYNGNLSIGGSTSTTTPSLTVNGNVTTSGSATVLFNGPLVVNGNMTIGNGSSVTFNGPVYITGNLVISGSSPVRLGSNYTTTSDTVVVDGTVNIGASGSFVGNGAGSYVIIYSGSSCGGTTSCSGTYAITVSGAAGAVSLLTTNGGISFAGSAGAKSAVGYLLNMSGAATLTYDSGLANVNFSTGPSGGWNTSSRQEISQ